MKRKNAFLEKMTEDELNNIRGGNAGPVGWKCDEPLPDAIKMRPQSSVYYAWLFANCTPIEHCSPTTWNPC